MTDKFIINIDNTIKELKPFNDKKISYKETPEGMQRLQLSLTSIDGNVDIYDVYLWKDDFDKLTKINYTK